MYELSGVTKDYKKGKGIIHVQPGDRAVGKAQRLQPIGDLRRQLDDRDVEVAAHQRSQEQHDGGAGAQADAHIGVAQRAELNHHDQDDEDPDQQREEGRGERKVMELAQVHGAGNIG